MNRNLTKEEYLQLSTILYDLSFSLHHFMVKSKVIALSTLINSLLNFSTLLNKNLLDGEGIHKEIEKNIKLFTWIDEKIWADSTYEYIRKLQTHIDFSETLFILQKISQTLSDVPLDEVYRKKDEQNTNIENISDILLSNDTMFEEDESEDGFVDATVLLNINIKESIQVGRGLNNDNDIIIGEEDRTVSRVHLKISTYKQGFFIEDVSTMGTFVDGKQIEKNVKKYVTIQNEIRLGQKKTILDLNHPTIKTLG